MSLTEFINFAPFLVSQALYWVYVLQSKEDVVTNVDYAALAIKCLPILALKFYILQRPWPKNERPTILGIFLGLLFSVIGDFFLFFRKRFFVLGMIAFALAQMIYIYTFSFKPFKFALCLPYYIYGLVFCVFLFPNVQDPMITMFFPVYGFLLFTMAWRALARAKSPLTIATAVGGLLFVISDSILAIDLFVKPTPHGHDAVMMTYFAAQFLITLSVTEIFITEDSKTINTNYKKA